MTNSGHESVLLVDKNMCVLVCYTNKLREYPKALSTKHKKKFFYVAGLIALGMVKMMEIYADNGQSAAKSQNHVV